MSSSSTHAQQLVRAVAVAVTVALLAACSSGSEALTPENLNERAAAADRDAGTFRFEWETAPFNDGPELYEGAIEYDDDGEVAALLLRSWNEDGALFSEQRYVDGALYELFPGLPYTEADAESVEQFLHSWDWAAATERSLTPESLERVGEDTIDGIDVVEYEATFEEFDGTYWIDDEDRVLRSVTSGEEADLPRGETFAHGEPVHIEEPLIVE